MFGSLLTRIQALRDQGCPDRIEHLRGNCSCGAKDPGQQANEPNSPCRCGNSCKCEEGECKCGTVKNFSYEAPTVH